MQSLRAPKGMNDLLPDAAESWCALEHAFRTVFRGAAFQEIRTPLVESTALFTRSIGEATDVVEKEMYTFARGDESLTLRPEGTASAVRAYVEHKFYANAPLARWFYVGPMFRAERPQKGRYRQFHQVGAEVIGVPGPYVDAEVIGLVWAFLKSLGLMDLQLLVNTLGSPASRDRYRAELVAYLEPLRAQLSEESQRRLDKNPLRILDSKAPADIALLSAAPRFEQCLSAEDQTQFAEFCAALNALGIPHERAPQLVRGLDYYTQTVFEIKGAKAILGAGDTLCGGGRYDNLVQELGGNAQPAFGFAAGIERLILAATPVAMGPVADVYVACIGRAAQLEGLKLSADLRAAGFAVELGSRGGKLAAQLTRANTVGARVALIIGDTEVAAEQVQFKNLQSGVQSSIAVIAVAAALDAEQIARRFARNPAAAEASAANLSHGGATS